MVPGDETTPTASRQTFASNPAPPKPRPRHPDGNQVATQGRANGKKGAHITRSTTRKPHRSKAEKQASTNSKTAVVWKSCVSPPDFFWVVGPCFSAMVSEDAHLSRVVGPCLPGYISPLGRYLKYSQGFFPVRGGRPTPRRFVYGGGRPAPRPFKLLV